MLALTHICSHRLRSLTIRLLPIAVLTGAGMLLYGDSAGLPFFSDDVAHLRWAADHSLQGVWTGAVGLGYFRPLSFTLWKLSLGLPGSLRAPLLHSLSVALHILNAVLVAALTRRTIGGQHRDITSLAAGALFLTFPFSYQVVPFVGALFHPLVTALVLGAILAASRAGAGSHWGWRALSLALTVAACCAHETGVVTGGLLLGYELLREQQGKARRVWLWPLAYLALGVAYVLVYLAVPRGAGPIPPPTRERLVQNGAYLLQGLAFAIAPVTRWTMSHWAWSDLGAAYLAVGLAAGLLALLCWRERTCRALCFALACFLLPIVPAWLLLPFSYVISGPRLLYLASVGAALAWACGLRALATLGRGRRRSASSACALLLLGITLAFGARFVRERQAIFKLGGDMVRQLSQTIAAAPTGERSLVVNCPAWLAPEQAVYPVGHEGVEFVSAAMSLNDLVWVNTGVRPEVQAVKFPVTLTPLPGLYIGVREPEVGWEGLVESMGAADRVYSFRFAPGALSVSYVGRLLGPAAGGTAPVAVFDNRVRLVSAEALSEDGQAVTVRLVWEADEQLTDAVYHVFAHLYNSSGTLLAQSDGYPMGGLYPFWIWRPGDRVEETRTLALPQTSPPGSYRVVVGIYDADGGRRLPALAPDGTPFQDDAVPVQVDLEDR